MAINKSWLNPANLPAVNPVNFPTLKHFFPVTETSGQTLTDTQGGVILSGFTDLVFLNGAASSVNGVPNTSPLASGHWSRVQLGDFLLLAVGNLISTNAAITLGDSLAGDSYLTIHTRTTAPVISDGTNITTATVIPGTISSLGAFGILRRGANLVSFVCSGSMNGYSEQAPVAITAGTDIIPMPDTFGMPAGFANISSLELWSFANGIYTDVSAMVNWSVGSRFAGASHPYPAWAGRS